MEGGNEVSVSERNYAFAVRRTKSLSRARTRVSRLAAVPCRRKNLTRRRGGAENVREFLKTRKTRKIRKGYLKFFVFFVSFVYFVLKKEGGRDARANLTRSRGGAEEWKAVMERALANGITHAPIGEQEFEVYIPKRRSRKPPLDGVCLGRLAGTRKPYYAGIPARTTGSRLYQPPKKF